ncbi:uncharacterized protein J3R85_002159 [Psidium guajava]|nr:uncharacterized protein J3R85_002159 [Psidium guajava]
MQFHSLFDRICHSLELRRQWRTIRFVSPAKRRAPASTASAERLSSGRAGGSATAATHSSVTNARKKILRFNRFSSNARDSLPIRLVSGIPLRVRAFCLSSACLWELKARKLCLVSQSAGCELFGFVVMMDGWMSGLLLALQAFGMMTASLNTCSQHLY